MFISHNFDFNVITPLYVFIFKVFRSSTRMNSCVYFQNSFYCRYEIGKRNHDDWSTRIWRLTNERNEFTVQSRARLTCASNTKWCRISEIMIHSFCPVICTSRLRSRLIDQWYMVRSVLFSQPWTHAHEYKSRCTSRIRYIWRRAHSNKHRTGRYTHDHLSSCPSNE
jgi:hypothetical protein